VFLRHRVRGRDQSQPVDGLLRFFLGGGNFRAEVRFRLASVRFFHVCAYGRGGLHELPRHVPRHFMSVPDLLAGVDDLDRELERAFLNVVGRHAARKCTHRATG
jgi:hypothetical protein